jgi:formylglycine-generating enzyme required for sulfatase activity
VGEVLVVVDTDLPVPKIASRLRVDFYKADGTWYATRDLPRSKPSDWPVSFGVALGDKDGDRLVVVRLRAYPEGKVRDYRGERYAERPTGGNPLSIAPVPAPTGAPRLQDANGNDVTPANEPQPLVTVDRLLALRVRQGARGAARVVLRGACVGTMSDLRDATALATCIDTEATLVPVTEEPLDADTSVRNATAAGTFESAWSQPCTRAPRPSGARASDGTPLHDEEACLNGGAFILGSPDGMFGGSNDAVPERVAVVPSFLLDKYEVTVGRWRKAMADGFQGAPPIANESDTIGGNNTPEPGVPEWCTWSAAPRGREELPVNCVPSATSRAFCRFLGGDLPTEAQWEYAATAAASKRKTHYPWGNADPSCANVVYSRGIRFDQDVLCAGLGLGPARVTEADHAGGDVSIGFGIVDLAGNVSEQVADRVASFASNCWMRAGLVSPQCDPGARPPDAVRGGDWTAIDSDLPAARRHQIANGYASTAVGFRCTRAGSAP